MSERREKILRTIQANPGIHVRGLMKGTGFENGVITHYLQQLEKQGQVKSQRRPKYKLYYSIDVTEDEFPIIRNMRKPKTLCVGGSLSWKSWLKSARPPPLFWIAPACCKL